ncbi:MAG TPA: HAMP domain-containing protein [Phycisphaerae bacterium]|jgi:signal transduction histidine kinase|nr:HAMP domain-containing protein [Phycisphaerae bacterium]HOB73982.1 HAMP domain-containing protein [Phycisphaerae bacterium]HOJ53887.1 HAMP domain-containing protein [Phycisphaerae bacterium]HOL26218.1 HAMP domain-containing protein [Phycisphaerae bacterium]HPP20205.1 HAMP domain-containing protein [Phycisphaerae bacterium]
MKLKHKFGLLAGIYISALVCNFALCAWCIILYYDVLLRQFGAPTGLIEWVNFDQEDTSLEPELPPPAGEVPAVPDVAPPAVPAHVDGTADIRRWVIVVLLLNAGLCVGVGLLGPLLVRRWVLRPVADLRKATGQIAAGDWSARIRPRSNDELGLLAGELNDTVAALVRLQEQLNKRERQITTTEALRCVVHNIRSPLTGIRWLAEVIAVRLAHDPQAAARQNRIIAIVDEVIGWLRDLRQEHSQDRPPPPDPTR